MRDMLTQKNHDKIISATNWEEETKWLLKAELSRRKISHQKLAELLNQMGIEASKASIDSKLSRGTFGAVFLLQCLRAIGCDKLRIIPE